MISYDFQIVLCYFHVDDHRLSIINMIIIIIVMIKNLIIITIIIIVIDIILEMGPNFSLRACMGGFGHGWGWCKIDWWFWCTPAIGGWGGLLLAATG